MGWWPNRTIDVYLQGGSSWEGVCWLAVSTMAWELKMSYSTIKRALRDFVREGLLMIEKRQRESRADSSKKCPL